MLHHLMMTYCQLRISHYSASPTAHSPDYVVDSEPAEDDPKEDPEEDLAYYPSKEEEEDEEPLALANSASPVPNSVPSSEETEPFEEGETVTTPPSPTPISSSIDAFVDRWVAAPAPPLLPPSPLLPLPSPLPKISSPPLPPPSPYRKGIVPKADMPPRKRARFATPSRRFEIGLWVYDHLGGRRTGWESDTTVSSIANDSRTHDSGSGRRRKVHTTRECTYKDFLNCQPLNFNGTEGAVGLAHWFEKIEYVFYICNCTVECQVKYATCTLLGGSLTWWNSHVRTVGHDAAYGMPWKTLKKMLTGNYYPRSEIKGKEIELWNLKVKGTDVVSYTQRFQELALLCARMLPKESDQVEKYTGGLPDSIQENVMSARPKTLQEAIELAKDLMGQKVRTYSERQADNKRSFDNN
ncbi:reverse transcriptase domain-containing protein [Tanacetum coccineum]